MVTNVSLQTLARTPRAGDAVELICAFGPGYAEVLAPHFNRLNEQSGQLLVFINGATFGGDDLKHLARLGREVRAEITHYGDSWPVSLGWELEPPHEARERFISVEKAQLNALLNAVDKAIARARPSGEFVRFDFWGGE